MRFDLVALSFKVDSLSVGWDGLIAVGFVNLQVG